MLKIGLTGSIAVGKTTVMARFAELGAICFDADAIARTVVEPGTPGLAAVVEEFGAGVLDADGRLDRAALGRVVFGDAKRRARLEQILHPAIIEEQDRLMAEAARRDPHAIAVVDAALMIESGGYKRFDGLIVVHCEPNVQRERLMRRNNLTAAEAEARIATQMPQSEKLAYATWTIDTTGTREDARRRTDEVWAELVASRDAL